MLAYFAHASYVKGKGGLCESHSNEAITKSNIWLVYADVDWFT